tara:strand:+ start:2636 stop:3325 length:690 start_codon:yes stop_codon:yes gene_type:complete
MKLITIIIPVYNEEKTIISILKDIKRLSISKLCEIIIINDGSTDQTKKLLKDNLEYYDHLENLENNSGKGKAIIKGLEMAHCKYIYFQDADAEYPPSNLELFYKNIGSYNLIIGSRFIGNERSILHFWHMIGNKIITFFFNFINNTTFTDIYCCNLIFERTLLNYKNLKSHRWGQQAEILTHLVKNSKKIKEISVIYDARSYMEGKKIRYYHVFDVIFRIIITKLKTFF